MKAEEALKLWEESQPKMDDILFTIQAMAKNGYRYAAWDKKTISEKVIENLKELGYEIESSDTNITAKW